ncbi:MAG: Ig-like domain-containing protein [Herpetosiphonaceae bacterium]|nr:Ig-like domain-containing protein [Herpetosiphonaceae bacterium]
MGRLGKLARWWWRWLLICILSVGIAALLVFGAALAGWLPTPIVISVTPAGQSSNVPPRSPLVLHFSTAMDAGSVEAALSSDPPAQGLWTWPDRRTAIWTPSPSWTPATSYTLRLAPTARSLLRQPLAAPFVATFATAPAPVVVFRSPPPGGLIDASAPLVLRFDRPLIPIELVESRRLPELTLTPPVSTTVRWFDAQTVVVAADFQPYSAYTATLGPLPDLLGTPVELAPWHFTTLPPALLAATALPAGQIAASAPFSLTFAGALSTPMIDQITRTLLIQPAISPTWQVATQTFPRPQTTLLLLPEGGWQAAVRYTATLALGPTLLQQWRWTATAPLQVVGTLPGRGGRIAPDGELRLVFSAPPNLPDLADRLTVEPAVSQLTTNIVGDQLRLRGAFSANTAYTVTLSSDLGPPFELPFQTSDAPDSLRLSAPGSAFSLWRPEQTPQITLGWSGSAQISAALYPLDLALLTNVLVNPGGRFEPDRYNLLPLRTWSVAPGAADQITLPLTATTPLSGGYVLHVRSDSGQLLQHIVVVSPYAVSLNASADRAEVWAIDLRTGQAAAELPLVVLSGGSQVAEGLTDLDGRWHSAIASGGGPLLLLGGTTEAPAVATLAQSSSAPPPMSATALLDRTVYAPGDALQVAGFVEWRTPPPISPTLELALIAADGQTRVALQSLQLTSAAFSASLPVRANYAPGRYDLRIAAAGQTLAALPFTIQLASPSDLRLRVPPRLAPGMDLNAEVVIREPNGLAGAGRSGRWRVTTADGGVLGSSGFVADAAGVARFNLPLPTDLSDTSLLISAESSGQHTSASLDIVAAQTLMIAVDRALVRPGETVLATVQVHDAAGAPVANSAVEINITGNAAPEILRRTTNSDGQILVRWQPPGSGRFELVASSGAALPHQVSVWAARPGFTGWAAGRDDQLALALESSSISAGQPVRLLPLVPASRGRAQLVWQIGSELSSQTLEWQAGVPLSLTLPLTASGRIPLSVALLTTERGLPTMRTTQVAVDVHDPADLSVTVAGRNPLQITTSSIGGLPLAAQVQLVVREISPPAATQRAAVALWLPAGQTNQAGVLTVPLDLPASHHGWQVEVLANAGGISARTRSYLPATTEPTLDLALPSHMQRGDVTTATLRLGAVAVPISATVLLTASGGIGLDSGPHLVALLPGQPTLLEIPLQASATGAQQLSISSTSAGTTTSLSQTIEVAEQGLAHREITGALITAPTVLSWTLPLLTTSGNVQLATAPALSDLRAAGQLALEGDPSLLAVAGRIALAQTTGLTPTLAADIASLRAAQQRDGGWSWDDGPSDPLLTALIVRTATTTPPNPAVEQMLGRSTAWLATNRSTLSNPDTQALVLAALARREQPVGAAISTLLDSGGLDPDSVVVLVTALYELQLARQAAPYLASLQQTQPWEAASARPWHSSARTAALAGQLLLLGDRDSPLLGGAIRHLGQTWTGTGWGDAAATTEALLLLRQLPNVPRGPYRISQNGTTLYAGSLAFSTTLPLSTTQISLTVEPGGALPVAVEQTWTGGAAPAAALATLTTRDALGAIIGPNSALPVGASASWELTLVVLAPLPYAEIHLALPAGVSLDALDAAGLALDPASLRGRMALLPVGVYPITLYGRPLLPGTATLPLPIITTMGQPLDVSGTFPLLLVR